MSDSSGSRESGRDAASVALAEHISSGRREAGLSQRELADLIGTNLWIVDELESGRKDPRAYLATIGRALGKPEDWASPELTPSGGPATATAADAPLMDAARLDRNLVLFVLVAILTIRFFTQQVGLLPQAGNFIDVLLLPFLAVAAVVRPTARMQTRSAFNGALAALAILFLALCALSFALNPTRVATGPVLLFVYGFLGPLGFYFAAFRLWPPGQSMALSRTIVGVGVLQFVTIALFDLPTFLATGNPDEIAGTFGGNAYQLVFYLLVFSALVAGIATFESERRVARLAPVLLAATFLTIFLAQYRALLATTALTVLFVGLMLGRSRGKGFVVGALALTAFVAGFGYVATQFPTTRLSPTIEAARSDPALFLTARVAPARDVLSLYGDDPSFVLTGTGPGTYSSRAWSTFASVGNPASAEGAAQPYATALTGGEAYHTDVADRYVLPRIREAPAVLGSYALTSPHSSYLALLAETGVIGFMLVVGMYLGALSRSASLMLASASRSTHADPLPALFLATAVAFFVLLQMAFLENWLEVARVTIPSWLLLAICIKEHEGRRGRT